jgi:NAD(P)-dependent dehydrogenase (short-subunit alcohol dehydrogenase family)/acyl carrier protein
LIFSDTGGLAQLAAQQLEEDGGETVLVVAGNRFDGSNPRQVTINLDKPEDYRRLFEQETSWRGVLHAWSLDTAFEEADILSGLERAERLGSRSALFLIQALTNIEASDPPKLWFLTRGAQPAWSDPDLGSIAQSPVWGLGRTAALEHPNFWGGLIDVSVEADPQILAPRIALEISSPDGEDQIALSEGLRMVPRLLSTSPPAPAPTIVKPGSSYLVTGGLGDLGPRIADWLAGNGAQELILCSRRALPARENWGELKPSHQFCEQIAAIQKFEEMGIKVRVEKVDIADRDQAESLFLRIRDSQTPLRGIVHAAAEIKLCALQEMSSDDLHSALRAKVEGTWWLHKFSQNLPLDFFVLFSSTAALFGASHLAHYAAANQFLDSFACWRRGAGLPALSVNWGTWEELRALGEKRDEAERFGLKGMPADLALQALSFLVTEGVAQRLVADVDWELLKPAVETRGRRPFFSKIRTKPTIDRQTDPKTAQWLKRLDGTAPEDRRELVSNLIAGEARRILGFHAEDQLDLDRGLFELGMDSLMSVQLKGRLEESIGCALPATLTFTYPTVHALTDFLLSKVLKLSTTGKADVESFGGNAEADEDLANLSDEEIKNMLSAELSSLPRDLRD